jgi:hypothetical protein
MTGTSPESVSRTFARWRVAGLVADGEHGWRLPDVEALERLADGGRAAR